MKLLLIENEYLEDEIFNDSQVVERRENYCLLITPSVRLDYLAEIALDLRDGRILKDSEKYRDALDQYLINLTRSLRE